MSKNNKGIVLIAFGKSGYKYAAFNLAMSIKAHNKSIQIALITDKIEGEVLHTGFFDEVIKLDQKHYMNNGKIDPALAKVSIYKYLPFTHNLYLDVDKVAFKDPEPLLDALIEEDGFYLTEVRGVGGKGDTINYDIWAKHSDVWEHFKLKKDAQFPAIQSSFAYIKRCNEAKSFFAKAKKNFESNFPISKLTMQWGGTLPDELIFSVTCAQKGIVPKTSHKPIFFGWVHSPLTLTEIEERHIFLSIYGNGNGQTLTKLKYLEWYDRIVAKYSRQFGLPHAYKRIFIMRDKHANSRK